MIMLAALGIGAYWLLTRPAAAGTRYTGTPGTRTTSGQGSQSPSGLTTGEAGLVGQLINRGWDALTGTTKPTQPILSGPDSNAVNNPWSGVNGFD